MIRKKLPRPRGHVEGPLMRYDNGLQPVNCNYLLHPPALVDDGDRKSYAAMGGYVEFKFHPDYVPNFKDFAMIILLMSFARKTNSGSWCTYFASIREFKKEAGINLSNTEVRDRLQSAINAYWDASVIFTSGFKRINAAGESVYVEDEVERRLIVARKSLRQVAANNIDSLEIELRFDGEFAHDHLQKYKRCLDAKVLFSIRSDLGKALYCYLWTAMYGQKKISLSLTELSNRVGCEELTGQRAKHQLSRAINSVNNTIISLKSKSEPMHPKIKVNGGIVTFETQKQFCG